MGGLVVGRPAIKLQFAVSVPLDLTSAISLVYRATDPRRFDPWLVETRQSLGSDFQHELDTLLGFSGRLLYYIEELLMSFDPFEQSRLDADFDALLGHLQRLPPWAYQSMVAQSVLRVYRDRGVSESPPVSGKAVDWKAFLEPGITRADLDEVTALVLAPEQLKARTVALLERFWRDCYGAEYERVGMPAFHASRSRRGTGRYREVPVSILESPLDLAVWARQAIAVARADRR